MLHKRRDEVLLLIVCFCLAMLIIPPHTHTHTRTRTHQVMSGFDEVEKLRRFLHYYERYKTHQESLTVRGDIAHATFMFSNFSLSSPPTLFPPSLSHSLRSPICIKPETRWKSLLGPCRPWTISHEVRQFLPLLPVGNKSIN